MGSLLLSFLFSLFVYNVLVVNASETLRKFNLAPGDNMVAEGWNGGGGGSSSSSSSSSSASDDESDSGGCFAGSETVLTKDGFRKPIITISVGEEVQVLDKHGKLTYSEVVYIPHETTHMVGTFLEVTTEGHKSVQITPTHLMPVSISCLGDDFKLTQAADLSMGICLQTVDGLDKIASIKTSTGFGGMYTVVTADDSGYIVVNDIVASSFAFTHHFMNLFYNVHRFFYRLFSSTFATMASESYVMVTLESLSSSILSMLR